MPKAMVVDDDPDICFLLDKYLTKNGFEVLTAHSLKRTLDLLQNNADLDVMLSDYRLDGIDGREMLQKVRTISPTLPVIFITGYNDLKTAVTLMKMGAYDYVLKPLFPEEILNTVCMAIEDSQQMEVAVNGKIHSNVEKAKLRPTTSNDILYSKGGFFTKLEQQIDLVGPTDLSVILYGESGTGKEVLAQQIHQKSKRCKEPFLAIDCGAISKELAGSELFGHEKGAFTGAANLKIGSFEAANGGTVFLDEIANLSYDIQVSLLRVVQERKMKRLGGSKDISLDIRIIIASNERLWDSVHKGKFREDLYHRFNEFSIDVPPLRERKDEIITFAEYFLKRANSELNKKVIYFSDEVLEVFKTYYWPGNLRELKNVIRRSVLLTKDEIIQISSLPFEITNFQKLKFDNDNNDTHEMNVENKIGQRRDIISSLSDGEFDLHSSLDGILKGASIDVEYELILRTLQEVNFNKSKAARLLNIDRKTLYNKMRNGISKLIKEQMKNENPIHIDLNMLSDATVLERNTKGLLTGTTQFSLIECEEFLKLGSWEYDLTTGSCLFSEGMYKIFEAEVLTNHDVLIKVVEDLLSKMNINSFQLELNEKMKYSKEFEIVDVKGCHKRVEALAKFEFRKDGSHRKFLGIIRDISKLKDYEKALEMKIDELNRSNKELEEFVHIASHDLYEPLRKISTFGNRLSTDAVNELSVKNQEYLSRMLNAVDNMRQLIDNLLDYSKVSRGTILWVDVDLNKILHEVLTRQELRIEETSAKIKIEVLPVIQGVPVLILQLFDNIIGNALKFQNKDNIPELRVSSLILNREDKLKYRLFQSAKYYQITISDNGIGFENIYADKIFQLFQRLNGKSEFSGSGIGLAVCRKITDVHKGIVFSESKPGIGSKFHIILPESQ